MSRHLSTGASALDSLETGQRALASGRWGDARAAFTTVLASGDDGAARFGLATALWWQGESRASVDECTRAYALFRRDGAVEPAIQSAVWLTITYKANFANFAAANGWIGRADRLLADHVDPGPGPLHAWAALARAYRMADLGAAEALTRSALDIARSCGDIDLELGALSQLGLIRVGLGHHQDGFALIDEAMAAALAGEGSNLDTVVYTSCDMLNACELTGDTERAMQWCRVADDFAATYGCPFLYAECRISYGSVLAATGRWADAERELTVGQRITAGVSPGLHARASTRLVGLWLRQGRLEEAEALLSSVSGDGDVAFERALSAAALRLARGDAAGASRQLERRLRQLEHQRASLADALELLVDAHLELDDVDAASAAAARLAEVVADSDSPRRRGALAAVRGRVAAAAGDGVAAVDRLESALAIWSVCDFPFELARTRVALARVISVAQPEAAIEQAQQALCEFETLGASTDADRAAALLRSLGAVARVGPKGVGTLTQREQEVLRLLGAGLSNPEIAQRLYISRKTAAHHVSSVLAKLHVRNRAEAAARAGALLGDQ